MDRAQSAEEGSASGRGLAAFCARYYIALLLGLLALALALRLWLALNAAYIWDEERDWIPEALAISLDPSDPHLPLRTEMHGALVAWLIRLGSLIGDGSHLAYRWTSILAGISTIAVTAALARRLAGPVAGLAAAALLCFNEYHVSMSALAIQISWYMLFSALAILFFLDYLDRRAGWRLVLAAVFAALSFLSYEIGGLTILILAIYALIRLGPGLFGRREFYLAAALGLAIILPDMLANLKSGTAGESYDSLLGRIVGIGFNPQYAAFLGRDLLEYLYPLLLGRSFVDYGGTYKAMNPLMGILLGGSVLYCLLTIPGWVRGRMPRHALFHLLLFFGVFGFFTLIETQENYTLWFWVGIILLPGAVLAGGVIALAGTYLRAGAIGIAVIGAVISLLSLTLTNYDFQKIRGHPKPDLLTGPPGSMAEMEVLFDLCDLCYPAPEFRLVDIGYVDRDLLPEEDVNLIQSSIEANAVQDAVLGTDDRHFRLFIYTPQVSTRTISRTYVIRYALYRQGNPVDVIQVDAAVPLDQAVGWPPIFWMQRQE